MEEVVKRPLSKNFERRVFLKYLGVGAGLAAYLFAGYNKKYYNLFVQDKSQRFGNGDIAFLNYVYSIEQLQAAFYIKATDVTFSWMSPLEESLFTVIRNQEVSHCQFFKDILGDNAISELEMDFSTIDFNDRSSVLSVAKTMKYLTVSAYNGIGQWIDNMDYLFAVGHLVAVELKHGVWIDNLIGKGGLEEDHHLDRNSVSPATVSEIISKYIKTKLIIPDL